MRDRSVGEEAGETASPDCLIPASGRTWNERGNGEEKGSVRQAGQDRGAELGQAVDWRLSMRTEDWRQEEEASTSSAARRDTFLRRQRPSHRDPATAPSQCLACLVLGFASGPLKGRE